MDNKEQELDTILDSLKEDMEAAMEQKINQMMKKVDRNKYTKDLKEILECGTKEEIYDVARNLGYTRISSLNKQKLAEKVIEEYEEKLRAYLYLIDETRYRDLKYVASQKGDVKLDDRKYLTNFEYYMRIGVLYPTYKGEDVHLVMPEVTQNIINSLNNFEYRSIVKRNTELISLFWGMINCYGILTLKDFQKLLCENYGYSDFEGYNLKEVLEKGSDFYESYIMKKDMGVHPLVPDADELKKKIKLEKEAKDYCKISKQEIIKAAVPDYSLNNEAMNKFKMDFVNNWNINKEELSLLLYDFYAITQVEDVEKVVELLCSDIELDNAEDTKKLEKLIRSTINSTRLWRLKGYKLKELYPELNEEEPKKVGRNEPCLCGSGKKYKKCCGKKN